MSKVNDSLKKLFLDRNVEGKQLAVDSFGSVHSAIETVLRDFAFLSGLDDLSFGIDSNFDTIELNEWTDDGDIFIARVYIRVLNFSEDTIEISIEDADTISELSLEIRYDR